MNTEIDKFYINEKKWQPEMLLLRKIVLECDLTETLKWRQPCYTFKNTNLIIVSSFKNYCVISFLKGVLLNDEKGLLIKPGENSQSVRFMKFMSVNEIIKLKTIIKEYIFETIETEKAGIKIDLKEKDELVYCDELKIVLSKKAALKKAFDALTPGRQRGYNIFFAAAKQSATRTQRIEKYTDRILSGKGLNDCVCGLSQKMPSCDGSHKFLKK